MLIHLDPSNPPRGIAKFNGSVRSLIEELEKEGGERKENVRICENFTCGLPIESLDELKQKLPLLPKA